MTLSWDLRFKRNSLKEAILMYVVRAVCIDVVSNHLNYHRTASWYMYHIR